MSNLRQAAQQALEALEELDGLDTETECVTIDVGDVITALTAALEQQAEPVARVAFEKWAKSLTNYIDLSRFETGYSDCNTDYAWSGWQAALAQPQQQAEPSQWRDMVVVSLVREGINKHKARELADHFATPPQQQAEPVAWMDREGDLYKMPEIKNWAPPHTMLYTAPPQRQWVGLTDDDVKYPKTYNLDFVYGTRWAEKKLKERNNG